MKQLLISLSLLVLATTAAAHPGVGIVEDRAGNVFFTDLKQVWRVSPAGRMSVAVPNVHTHELCVDAAGNLLGEHVWSDGAAASQWNQRLWRLSPTGELSDIVKARPAFQEGDSFVRDKAGTMYWASHDKPVVIRKATAAGVVSTHAAGVFSDVRWMTVAPEGTLYLMDQGDLRRVSADGAVTLLASRLSSLKPAPAKVRDPYYHQGLWTDREGSVYVAVSEEQVVMRVRPGKAPEVVKSTAPDWSPSGGLVDRKGDLWVLEYDRENRVRAVRFDRHGREQVFDTKAPVP